MAGRKLLFNMALLTASGMVSKTIDFSFRAFYSAKLTEEGMGIFSLVMSAFGIILNLSSAGVGAAVSRIASIKFRQGDTGGARKATETAIYMVISIGVLCCFLVFWGAERIAISYLNDIRCTRGLICIAPASVFMGISYCIKGYFYADRQVLIPASSEFVEQAVKISLISFLLSKWLNSGIENGVCAVFLGLTVGEMCSCLYLVLWYIKVRGRQQSAEGQLLPLLSQTLPMTVSAVSGAYLRMQEDIWIVRGLKKFGLEADAALGTYGLIHGMAMPLLVFPLTLISSVMALLIPEISRAKEGGRIRYTVKKVYETGWFFGCMIFCIFFVFAKEISFVVYGSHSAAEYIRPLCVLCPIMIIDSLSTGMLGGLGEQSKLLKYSLMDSALRLSLIYFLLPYGGNKIIILMIFLSNIMTCLLTVRRVNFHARVGAELLNTALAPVISSVLTVFLMKSFIPYNVGFATLCGLVVLTAGVFSAFSIVFFRRGKLCLWRFHL